RERRPPRLEAKLGEEDEPAAPLVEADHARVLRERREQGAVVGQPREDGVVEPGPDPAALEAGLDRELGQLEVVGLEPLRAARRVERRRDLVVPPLAGRSRVAVDEAGEPLVRVEGGEEAEAPPARV